jgi:hypothetical protein
VTYALLSGVRVLELSLLAPDMLGMHMADLGADLIKIEQPPRGDCVREIGAIVGRYPFDVRLFHPLLHAGLSRRSHTLMMLIRLLGTAAIVVFVGRAIGCGIDCCRARVLGGRTRIPRGAL